MIRTGARRLLLLALAGIASLAGTLTFAGTAHAEYPYVQIVNYNSGKCLQPRSTAANAVIEQRSCSATSQIQQWTVAAYGATRITLVNRSSGLCLDVAANSEAEVVPNVALQQFYCWPDGYTSERWFTPSGSRVNNFQLVNHVGVNGSMCADIRGSSTSNGAVAIVNGCDYYDNSQNFRFAIF